MAPETQTTEESLGIFAQRRLRNMLVGMRSRITSIDVRKNSVYCSNHGLQGYKMITAFGEERMLCDKCATLYFESPATTDLEPGLNVCIQCGSSDNGILNMHECQWCQRDVCGACVDWGNSDKDGVVCASCSHEFDTEMTAELMDKQVGE